MKLNFWQWLGIILLIIGGVVWFYDGKKKPQDPTTQPATAPAY